MAEPENTQQVDDSPPNADNVINAIEAERNANNEPEIPEKFRGKSQEEIIQSYQELESRMGKQSNELGELRRTFDAFVKSELENRRDRLLDDNLNQQPTNHDTLDGGLDPRNQSSDFLAGNDQGGTDNNVSRELAELRRERFLEKMGNAHPKFKETIKDEAFRDWVVESNLRQELYMRGDQGYDFDASNELFTLWEEKQQREKADADAQAEKEKAAADAEFDSAKMDVGTPANPSSKQRYRRSDIRALMQNNPTRYQELQDEIMAAYREGRVFGE